MFILQYYITYVGILFIKFKYIIYLNVGEIENIEHNL